MKVDFLYAILKESWNLFLEVSPFLILGFFFAGVIHVFIGRDLIRKHLGGGGFMPVLKSVLFGIPLPICSCGVIPLSASLRREGAGRAPIMSFLFATPVTGVDSILATYAFLGFLFAVFRPMAALAGGILLGVFSYFSEKDDGQTAPAVSPTSEPSGSRFLRVFSYGFLYLPKEIGSWLIVGVLLGGAITALIPDTFVEGYFHNPWIAYPLMLAMSIPVYVCATGSIPIAAALIWKGLVPGAALAFLIAGPATNTVTAAFVWKELGKRQFVLYLAVIVIISLGSGLAFDAVWNLSGSDPEVLHGGGKHLAHWVKLFSALILLPLFLRSYLPGGKKTRIKGTDILLLQVSGMTCQGCVNRIREAVLGLEGVEEVDVDFTSGELRVRGETDVVSVENAVKNAGYDVERT